MLVRVMRMTVAMRYTAMAIAGMISWSRLPHGFRASGIHVTGGIQWRNTEVTSSAMVANQKLGSERPSKPQTRAARSKRVFGLTDETTPNGIPTTVAITVAMIASSTVIGR